MMRPFLLRPRWAALWVFLLLGGALLFWQQSAAQTATETGRMALVTAIEGPIGPATARQVADALAAAHERRAALVILTLNTPGGLSDSMRTIISAILASDIPVIGYVAPPGARAASAGTYILYATSLAAMAPGTNLGAATPIQIGGIPGLPGSEEKPAPKGSGDTLERKIVSDAVAFIRALAELRGRNADWAEKAVREAASLSAQQALAAHVVELVVPDLPGLLAAADGRTVETAHGKQVLHTRGLQIESFEPGFMTRLLGVIANPEIAFVLMLIGIYGLIFEFANPGTIGPGVIGAIALVLGLFALNQLPLDYAGLALVLLGLGLMVAEAFAQTFGVLALGGLAAFVFGAAMLFNSNSPEFRLSWTLIAGTALFSAAFFVFLIGYVWRAHRRPVVTGREDMEGATARVTEWADGEGAVWVHGERWQARGPRTLAAGDSARITALEGLTLIVTETAPGHDPQKG